MVVGIRTHTFSDPVGRSRRHRAWFTRGIKVGAFVLVVGGIGWAIFLSSLFAVTDIHVQGAVSIGDDTVTGSIRALLSQRRLYVLQPLRNVILLDTGAIADHLKSQYAAIGTVVVTKHYPHVLDVTVTERQAVGTWCRLDDCQFFDADGARWGQTVLSTGPLLLLVRDDRSEDSSSEKLFRGIMTAVKGLPELGLTAKDVTLPDNEPGGITIRAAKGYDLLMDGLGNVPDQLEVLGVFLSDRAKEPSFTPKYVDLRTPGRVYYK